MATFCHAGQLPSVKIVTPSGSQKLNFGNAPIDVEEKSIGAQNQKCWRFWSTNNGVTTDEFFACGVSAYYQSDASLENNGAWLFVDGKNAVGQTYYYWSGNFNGTLYNRYLEIVNVQQPTTGANSGGSCSNCVNNCAITISDANTKNQLWTNTYSYPCNQISYDVACSGCHDGELQCSCTGYPGYCCVDCGSVESRLDNLIQVVKRLDSADGVTK